MHEQLPQIAEHAFGYSVKTQVIVDNPKHAVLLGLRRFGWMTFDQCKIRIFSWSMEYANNPAPCHRTIVADTLFELEELGLVRVVISPVNTVVRENGSDHGILEVWDTNHRITKRYEHCKNERDV